MVRHIHLQSRKIILLKPKIINLITENSPQVIKLRTPGTAAENHSPTLPKTSIILKMN